MKLADLVGAAARRMQASSAMRTLGAVGAGVMVMILSLVVILRGPLVVSATITIAMSVLVMTVYLRWREREIRRDRKLQRRAARARKLRRAEQQQAP